MCILCTLVYKYKIFIVHIDNVEICVKYDYTNKILHIIITINYCILNILLCNIFILCIMIQYTYKKHKQKCRIGYDVTKFSPIFFFLCVCAVQTIIFDSLNVFILTHFYVN